jgi:predicted GNAT family acetyltransferase
MNSPGELLIRHNRDESRFDANVDGSESVADYVIDRRRMIFTHTFVPPELRGRGIAEKLVRAGLEWARTQGYQVVPQCSYVAVFIQRHAEYQDLLRVETKPDGPT